MKGTAEVRCVLSAQARVGEGPVWSQADQVLWWVDIAGPELHRFDPLTGLNETWQMPGKIGCLALREAGGLVVALEDGFSFFDPRTGQLSPLGGLSPAATGARFNDGVVSPEGRFLATTMQSAPPFDDPIQSVQMLHRDLTTSQLTSGLRVGNGLAFSPDGGTLYLSDSHVDHAAIWAFDWDGEKAHVSNRRLFFDPAEIDGQPDGAAIDSEGFYWFAAVGGWQVVRLTPDGRIDRTIAMPIEKPSKVVFGGPEMDLIFVTSISMNLVEGCGREQPQAGGLFVLEAGVQGASANLFLG